MVAPIIAPDDPGDHGKGGGSGGGGLTDAELRATPVDVAVIGEVEVKNDAGNPLPVSGPLTDAELRATPVPVSGTVTITDGSGPVTVDGTVTANIGTTNGLALDATLTGGTQKSILHGVGKGTTVAADATVTTVDGNHNAVDVNIAGGTLALTQVAPAMDTGGKSITTATTQMVTASTPSTLGVLVKAYVLNTDTVFIGDSSVTAGTADATDGIPIEAGETVTIPIDNANKIYGKSVSGTQKIYFMAL